MQLIYLLKWKVKKMAIIINPDVMLAVLCSFQFN
jgi:hypothetical protein